MSTLCRPPSLPLRFQIPVVISRLLFWTLSLGAVFGFFPRAIAEENVSTHGLWVWKGPSVLEGRGAVERLRDFCQSQGINEIYISVSDHGNMSGIGGFSHLIDLLHGSNIRVEALLSSENADEAGQHREKLLDHVREILQFNQDHRRDRFDGIHLDVEPQQRPENKGVGNLRFLPGLVDAYREVRALASPAGLTVNADIQNKLLKGSLAERQMLLSSLPRLTLMLYELSSPDDGENLAQKTDKLRIASQRFLAMAYEGLRDPNLAKMVIGLRTPDYGELLPQMLMTLDQGNRMNPRYQGWARHSYNDSLETSHSIAVGSPDGEN
jgi:hypothetical protein